MFSTLLFAAIAAAIFCFSFVDAIPYRASDSLSHYRGNQKRDVVTSNVLPLRRSTSLIKSRRGLEDKVERDDGSYKWGRTALSWQALEQNLVTSITVNGQEFTVLVDTASRYVGFYSLNLSRS